MVCINPPDPADPDDLSPAEMLRRLQQIRRDALVNERALQEVIASSGLAASEVGELTKRLTAIKALAGGFMGDGGLT
jgi:hypothetical protein